MSLLTSSCVKNCPYSEFDGSLIANNLDSRPSRLLLARAIRSVIDSVEGAGPLVTKPLGGPGRLCCWTMEAEHSTTTELRVARRLSLRVRCARMLSRTLFQDLNKIEYRPCQIFINTLKSMYIDCRPINFLHHRAYNCVKGAASQKPDPGLRCMNSSITMIGFHKADRPSPYGSTNSHGS